MRIIVFALKGSCRHVIADWSAGGPPRGRTRRPPPRILAVISLTHNETGRATGRSVSVSSERGEKHYPSRDTAVLVISNDNEAAYFASRHSRISSRERAGSLPFHGADIPIDFDPSRGTCTRGSRSPRPPRKAAAAAISLVRWGYRKNRAREETRACVIQTHRASASPMVPRR